MHLFKDQTYVENLTPSGGSRQKYPIVFIHGQAQSGTVSRPSNPLLKSLRHRATLTGHIDWVSELAQYARRPPSWASWFLQQGYEVYLIDQPQRGRSAYMPGDGSLATYIAEFISWLFTAVQSLGSWPQAKLHTQWPGVSCSLSWSMFAEMNSWIDADIHNHWSQDS